MDAKGTYRRFGTREIAEMIASAAGRGIGKELDSLLGPFHSQALRASF